MSMRTRLKLYTGEGESTVVEEPRVTMRLGEMAQIIGDAARFKRTWLDDFEDEEVQISADLYELLSAYWQLRPGA